MKYLPKFIRNTKAGFSKEEDGSTAVLVKRNEYAAIYRRSDGYYEVGERKFSYERDVVMAGIHIHYEDKEHYWTNKDFGEIAKCTSSKKKAEVYFDEFTLRARNRETISKK